MTAAGTVRDGEGEGRDQHDEDGLIDGLTRHCLPWWACGQVVGWMEKREMGRGVVVVDIKNKWRYPHLGGYLG